MEEISEKSSRNKVQQSILSFVKSKPVKSRISEDEDENSESTQAQWQPEFRSLDDNITESHGERWTLLYYYLLYCDVCGRNATKTSRLSLSGILEFEADKDLVPGNLPEMDWDVDFANIKDVIDGAEKGLDDHGQSNYAPNSDAQDQDRVKEMLQWFREAIPNLTEPGLIQYQMA